MPSPLKEIKETWRSATVPADKTAADIEQWLEENTLQRGYFKPHISHSRT